MLPEDIFMVTDNIDLPVDKKLGIRYSGKSIFVSVLPDGGVFYGDKKLTGYPLSCAIENNASLRCILEHVEE